MPRTVIILSLADEPEPTGEAADGSRCGTGKGTDSGTDTGIGGCGSGACGSAAPGACSTGPRVPVLACRDTLAAHGHDVELVTATSDKEIDAVLARFDGPARDDGLTWPSASDQDPALVIAATSDAQVRAVVRRMVRRYTPPASRRPKDVVDGRTVPDLPPVAILALGAVELVDRPGLPRDPADVAKAVAGGTIRRLDLFRTDAGSITLHGTLLGGVDATGQAVPWRGRVTVDDTPLADPGEPILACAVANADGYARLDEIPLTPNADPASGSVTVAVAVPVITRSRLGRAKVRIEVRRATGRAVSVVPAADLPIYDDGVEAVLTRKRTWWVEPGAWAVFTP